jgi:hypothetical protein
VKTQNPSTVSFQHKPPPAQLGNCELHCLELDPPPLAMTLANPILVDSLGCNIDTVVRMGGFYAAQSKEPVATQMYMLAGKLFNPVKLSLKGFGFAKPPTYSYRETLSCQGYCEEPTHHPPKCSFPPLPPVDGQHVAGCKEHRAERTGVAAQWLHFIYHHDQPGQSKIPAAMPPIWNRLARIDSTSP